MLVLESLALLVANSVHLVGLVELFESLPFCWDQALPQRLPVGLAEARVAALQPVVEQRSVSAELEVAVVLVADGAFVGWAEFQLLVLV